MTSFASTPAVDRGRERRSIISNRYSTSSQPGRPYWGERRGRKRGRREGEGVGGGKEKEEEKKKEKDEEDKELGRRRMKREGGG